MAAAMGCLASISGIAWWINWTPQDVATIGNEIMAICAMCVGVGCFYTELNKGK